MWLLTITGFSHVIKATTQYPATTGTGDKNVFFFKCMKISIEVRSAPPGIPENVAISVQDSIACGRDSINLEGTVWIFSLDQRSLNFPRIT